MQTFIGFLCFLLAAYLGLAVGTTVAIAAAVFLVIVGFVLTGWLIVFLDFD